MPKVTISIDGEDHTIELSEETLQMLLEIARRNNLSLADALTQAVNNERFIEQEIASGGELLVAKGDKLRKLDLEPA